MANFLTREEDLKNGYFLKEVLGCTCFVDGDDEIYKSFLQECRAVRDRQNPDDLATRLAKYIILNPADTVSGIHVDFFARQESIKRLTYRPLTTQLAYLARLCGIECQSSFEILDAMKGLKVVDDETYHNIAYALAVAIEGGPKAYADTGHQRRAIVPADWVRFVGSKGWIVCQVVLDILRTLTRIMPPTRCFKLVLPPRVSDHWHKCGCLHMPTIALFQEGAIVSLRLVISTLEQYTSGNMDAFAADMVLKPLFGNLRHCFLRMYLQHFEHVPGAEILVFRRDHPSDYANELVYCEWACQKMLQISPIDEIDVAAYQSLCVIRFNQGRYDEGLAFFEQWSEMFRGSEHEKNFLDMWMYEMIMRREVMGNERALKFIEHELSEKVIIERRCVLMISRCEIWLKSGRNIEAEKELLRIMYDIKANCRQMSKYSYEYLLKFVREVLIENKFYEATEIATKFLSDVLEESFTPVLRMAPDRSKERDRNLLAFAHGRHDPQKLIQDLRSNQAVMSDQLVAITRSLQLSVCLNYDEMMRCITIVMAQTRYKTNERPYFMAYVSMLMTLYENIQASEVPLAVKAYYQIPSRLRVSRAVQPFIYGFLKEASRDGSTRNMLQYHERIFRGIFGCTGEQISSSAYNSALSHFVALRFPEAIKLLWKLCHWEKTSPKIRCLATELLITVTATALVVQKRKNPAKYFLRTREVSRKQQHWILSAANRRTAHNAARNMALSKTYIYADLPLVPVYNLAIECNDVNLKRLCLLQWKIIHCSTDFKRVKKASVLLLFDAVYFCFYSRQNVTMMDVF